MTFRDDVHGMTVFREQLQQLPSDLQRLLGRLIGVRVGTDRYRFALVAGLLPLVKQPSSGVGLVEDLSFKVESRGKIQIAVAGSRITIDAAMFTPLIGIDGSVEGDVRRIIAADDSTRLHGPEYGFRGCRGSLLRLRSVKFGRLNREAAVRCVDGAAAFVRCCRHGELQYCINRQYFESVIGSSERC